MLVTNRGVVQNVLEWLRGIDRTTQFRSVRIKGKRQLELLHPESRLREAYFENFGIQGLGDSSCRRIRCRLSGLTPPPRQSLWELAEKCYKGSSVFCADDFAPDTIDALTLTGLIVPVNDGIGIVFPEPGLAATVSYVLRIRPNE